MIEEVEWNLLKTLENMIFKNSRISPERFLSLMESEPLLLVAYDTEKIIGFKLGYRKNDETFHSWLGGVQSDYRRRGIAQELLRRQEQLIQKRGMTRITFNTYARFKPMIQLGEKHGYRLLKQESIGGELKFFYEKLLRGSQAT